MQTVRRIINEIMGVKGLIMTVIFLIIQTTQPSPMSSDNQGLTVASINSRQIIVDKATQVNPQFLPKPDQ